MMIDQLMMIALRGSEAVATSLKFLGTFLTDRSHLSGTHRHMPVTYTSWWVPRMQPASLPAM